MKSPLSILLLSLVFVSCLNHKKQEVSTFADKGLVTFVITGLPEHHDYKQDLYISGDFEGWSGGKDPFKLNKTNNQYQISIPKYSETLSFKFTQGNWATVECETDGNPIDNRVYSFTTTSDTVAIKILNWNNPNQKNKPTTASKNVHVFAEEFEMPQLQRKRKISVYLPPDYDLSKASYPVLYIQDGQNVFDVNTSYSGEWEVDETLNTIYNETGFGLIVVAINHANEKRLNEYSAWDNKRYGKGEGALYLDFLVNQLKPEIDKAYRTKPDSENTGISGSSLGGLFAHYATVKRPDVFGKSMVFSPTFWYAKASFQFTKMHPNTAKFYYLVGEKEGQDMVDNMNAMVELMLANNFSEENIYKKIVPHGMHSESFWKTEFKPAVLWLFVRD